MADMPEGVTFEFVDETVGMNIPSNFIPAIEKVIQKLIIGIQGSIRRRGLDWP